MQEVGADEEEEDEGGRGVGGDEEKGEPAAKWSVQYSIAKTRKGGLRVTFAGRTL